jgi:hypothetical protein
LDFTLGELPEMADDSEVLKASQIIALLPLKNGGDVLWCLLDIVFSDQ